jgi:hypothetical protein
VLEFRDTGTGEEVLIGGLEAGEGEEDLLEVWLPKPDDPTGLRELAATAGDAVLLGGLLG